MISILYSSITAKIARIAYNLICNHPFVDSNKRIGTYVMSILLDLNNIDADFSDDDIIRIGLSVADSKMDYIHLLDLMLNRLK